LSKPMGSAFIMFEKKSMADQWVSKLAKIKYSYKLSSF
jgi:hypothetical protein